MAKMAKDLMLNDDKFSTAVSDIANLKKRTDQLKKDLGDMYDDLKSALDTESGQEVEIEAKKTLLKPVENMSLVIGHISDSLNLINGGGYYKDVFDGFDNLKNTL